MTLLNLLGDPNVALFKRCMVISTGGFQCLDIHHRLYFFLTPLNESIAKWRRCRYYCGMLQYEIGNYSKL